jgi:TolB-like protein/class 3 adenylate cyclase
MDRRLAAILIADAVGYSRLSHLDEEGTRARFLDYLKSIFEPEVAKTSGRIVKTMGDGLLVEFPSVVSALRCALATQEALAKANARVVEDTQLQFRIGINLGDVIAEGEDVHGDGVNIADRLQGLADPGGIIISGTAYDHVHNKIDVGLESLGQQRVKNITEPVRAYRIVLDTATKQRRYADSRARNLKVPTLIATVLIIALAGWWVWSETPRPAAAEPALAVLPFDNLSGDTNNGRLADAVVEDIITDLSRYPDFRVISRNSTEVYRGKPTDVRQVGKDLNVGYVLEGSFQRENDRVRITAQLIETDSGTHVWSERYDRPAAEVFDVQSEVADRIANSLGGSQGQVPGHALAAAKRKRPTDLNAYELYLLGHEKIQGTTLESQLEAKQLLERAIQIDPTFARAHTMLAWTYAWRATFEADVPKLIQEMLKVASHAVELDPLDFEAHQALGYASQMSGDVKRAEIEFDKSLELNPKSFDALALYSCFGAAFGKAKAGADAVDQAIRVNPNYPNWAVTCFRLGLFMVGRYEEAVTVQSRQPEDQWNSDGFVITASSLAGLGRTDEAKSLVARGMAKFPGMLSIEKFALNRGWSPKAVEVLPPLMRKAGFPPCATDDELKGIANPARLPECVKT